MSGPVSQSETCLINDVDINNQHQFKEQSCSVTEVLESFHKSNKESTAMTKHDSYDIGCMKVVNKYDKDSDSDNNGNENHDITDEDSDKVMDDGNDSVKMESIRKKRKNDAITGSDDDDDDDNGNDGTKVWTIEEDKLLFELYKQFGSQWASMCNYLPRWSRTQIKTRYKSIKRASDRMWKKSEEELLLRKCLEVKRRDWARIASHFPGRSKNAVKIHFKHLMGTYNSSITYLSHVPPAPGSPRQSLLHVDDYAPIPTKRGNTTSNIKDEEEQQRLVSVTTTPLFDKKSTEESGSKEENDSEKITKKAKRKFTLNDIDIAEKQSSAHLLTPQSVTNFTFSCSIPNINSNKTQEKQQQKQQSISKQLPIPINSCTNIKQMAIQNNSNKLLPQQFCSISPPLPSVSDNVVMFCQQQRPQDHSYPIPSNTIQLSLHDQPHPFQHHQHQHHHQQQQQQHQQQQPFGLYYPSPVFGIQPVSHLSQQLHIMQGIPISGMRFPNHRERVSRLPNDYLSQVNFPCHFF